MSEQYSLEEEIQHAHTAYQIRDYENTIFHIAGALAQDPINSEALNLFDIVLAEAPDPQQLIILNDNNFYGEVIAGAYIKAQAKDYEAAINLLTQVFTQFPELELELWLNKWLTDARFCAAKVNIDPIIKFLQGLISDPQERIRLRPAEILFYKRFTRLIMTLEKYYYDSPEIMILGANILRRAERYEETQLIATSRFKKDSPIAAITQAMAYRAAGQYNRAIQSFEQAWKISSDPTLFIEMAKAKWDAGGQKAAAKLLKKGAKKAEDHFKNNHVFNLMQRYLKADKELLDVLGPEIRPDDFIYLTSPLQGYLLPIRDASLTSLASLEQDKLHGQSIQIAVNCIEPPSVRLALAMITTGDHDISALEYIFDDIPAVDPRATHNSPEFQVWKYEASIPCQDCKQPAHNLVALVLSLAHQEFYLPRWWAQAKKLMTGHSVNLQGFTGVMVYPPDLPDDMEGKLDIGQWLKHVQIASALLIAASENQWKKSLRRDILLTLLDGPIDWVTEATLMALTEIGLDCPESIPEISHMMESLAERIPETGYWSIAATLPICYKRLPGRPYYIINSMNNMLSRYNDTVSVLSPQSEEQSIEDSIDASIEESLLHQLNIDDHDFEDTSLMNSDNANDSSSGNLADKVPNNNNATNNSGPNH
ncbi:hypothetical protein MNBD_GAMMA12-508 [hydrothermal vent metagenome]|uniref:Uncharacterized protein n=1 Tax=hydrothermal vent metagenome TaxID=652676 RepID=A0A3B0YVY1_9ZZZZ